MNTTISKDYSSLNHSKFLIKYHIIFVCKYRRLVLANKIIDKAMKNILLGIADGSDFCIEMMESDKDHIHMMIS
ncbi:MAG: IS200/IS605 family transposase, partial [Prevotella sp.]